MPSEHPNYHALQCSMYTLDYINNWYAWLIINILTIHFFVTFDRSKICGLLLLFFGKIIYGLVNDPCLAKLNTQNERFIMIGWGWNIWRTIYTKDKLNQVLAEHNVRGKISPTLEQYHWLISPRMPVEKAISSRSSEVKSLSLLYRGYSTLVIYLD